MWAEMSHDPCSTSCDPCLWKGSWHFSSTCTKRQFRISLADPKRGRREAQLLMVLQWLAFICIDKIVRTTGHTNRMSMVNKTPIGHVTLPVISKPGWPCPLLSHPVDRAEGATEWLTDTQTHSLAVVIHLQDLTGTTVHLSVASV